MEEQQLDELDCRLQHLLPLIGLIDKGRAADTNSSTHHLEIDFIKSLLRDFRVEFISPLLPDPGLRFRFLAKDGIGRLNRGAAVETLFDVLSGLTLKVFDRDLRESATTHFVFDLAVPVRPDTQLVVDVVVMKITPGVAFTELTLLADTQVVAKGTHTKLFLSCAAESSSPAPPPQMRPDPASLPPPQPTMTRHHQLHHHRHHQGGYGGPAPPPLTYAHHHQQRPTAGAGLERDGSVHVLIESVGQPPSRDQPTQRHMKRSVMASSGRGRADPFASSRF